MKILHREPSNTLTKTDVWTVESEFIAHPMAIWITVPDSFAWSTENSVHGLMLNDGNAAAGTGNQITRFLIAENLMPPTVQVAVGYPLDHPYETVLQRNAQLTPTPWPAWDRTYGALLGQTGPASGQGEQYRKFLTKEVMPLAEEEYGIDPSNWTLAGHSLGGLFTVYSLLKDPKAFRRYLGVGSSFWWKNGELFSSAMQFSALEETLDLDVYLAAGSYETEEELRKTWNSTIMQMEAGKAYLDVMGRIPDIVSDSEKMAKILSERDGVRCKTEILINETHGTAALAALNHGLRWLYRKS